MAAPPSHLLRMISEPPPTEVVSVSEAAQQAASGFVWRTAYAQGARAGWAAGWAAGLDARGSSAPGLRLEAQRKRPPQGPPAPSSHQQPESLQQPPASSETPFTEPSRSSAEPESASLRLELSDEFMRLINRPKPKPSQGEARTDQEVTPDLSHLAGGTAQRARREKKRAMYGNDAERVMEMENHADAVFRSRVSSTGAHYWPVIPL
ncbi:hypothetical protein BWQ96_00630 [Gracilariopsis chorda]|uniref:Uncharacterized protein n=1 Tax=Gracilariopsis chorda TaxID=448386 RepID=A0A2V3J9I6_9FLOR|nr:hypothetical protein BWQ96_00630 [Gracilariopsis chorda]|eukprot:PXF49560.1 hypothetical protein BWQ96_00630 [Gracilariopsis chorda]